MSYPDQAVELRFPPQIAVINMLGLAIGGSDLQAQADQYYEITKVEFGRGGKKLGTFEVMRRKGQAVRGGNEQRLKWVETTKTGATAFTFQELDRAYDALFLYDRSRRVNIEINFRTNKIYYSEGPPTSPELRRHPKSSRPVLYDVLSKSAGLVRAAPGTRRPEDEIYSGFSNFPKQVRYFRRNRLLGLFWNKYYVPWNKRDNDADKKRWVETCLSYPATNAWLNQTKNPSCTDPTEERFSFKETGYDACSVYLYDASRRVHIRIDFYKKKIYYRDANSPERELYDIKDAKNLEQRPDGSLPSVAVSHA